MTDFLFDALEFLEDWCDRTCNNPNDVGVLQSDVPSNNIYTALDNADQIDDHKIDSILSYLDHLLITWYPSPVSSTSPNSPSSKITSLQVSSQIRPHLHRQLDLINEFPIDNNGLTWNHLPHHTTSTTSSSSFTRIKHSNYLNSRFDSLTTFDECEGDNDVLSFLQSTLPRAYQLKPTSEEQHETISLPLHILHTHWYQTLSDTIPSIFVSTGIYLPFLHSASPSNPSGPFSFQIFLIRCLTFIPIILISSLILFNYKVFIIDWFHTSAVATRTILQNRAANTSLLSPNPLRAPLPESITVTDQNPFGLSLFPQFILQSPILTQLSFLILFLYIIALSTSVLLILLSLCRSHFTSNSIHDHKPNRGYYTELQRRTIYTYYCLLNHYFPPQDYKDDQGNIIAMATPRSSFLITPFPTLLSTQYTLSNRLKRMLLCEPDRFLSISRCSKCDKNIYRPPGTHHCSSCGCSAGFDHHCLFIGADVGIWSHKYFINFIFWASIGAALYTPIGFYFCWSTAEHIFSSSKHFSMADPIIFPFFVFFCTMLTACFAVVLSVFTYFHLKLIINDSTTFDYVTNTKEKMSVSNNDKSESSNSSLGHRNGNIYPDNDQTSDDEVDNNISSRSLRLSDLNSINNKSLWERRLCRILGPSRLLWFIPVDTMFLHRRDQRKTRLFLDQQAGSESHIQPTYVKLNLDDDDDDDNDNDNDDADSGNNNLIQTEQQSFYNDANINSLDTNSTQQDLSFINSETEIYYTKQLYIESEYFYPYQFTHHFFSFPLLLPEQYGFSFQRVQHHHQPMLQILTNYYHNSLNNIGTSTMLPLSLPTQLSASSHDLRSNPHSPHSKMPADCDTTSLTSTHQLNNDHNDNNNHNFTPSKPKILLPPPISVSSSNYDTKITSNRKINNLLTTTTTFLPIPSNNDKLLDFIQQIHISSEFDDLDTLSFASTFDSIDSDIEL